MPSDKKQISYKLKARAKKVQERISSDKNLAKRYNQAPEKLIAEEVLNPVVLGKTDVAAAEGGCQCSIGSCGVGCQPAVGSQSYGCVSGQPL